MNLHDGETGKTMACFVGIQPCRPFGILPGVYRAMGPVFLYIKILLLRLLHTRERIAPHRMASKKCPRTKLITCGGDCGDEQILQAATADPFGLNTTTSPTTDHGTSSWSISWKWPSSSWRSSSGANNLSDEVECSEDGAVVQPPLLIVQFPLSSPVSLYSLH